MLTRMVWMLSSEAGANVLQYGALGILLAVLGGIGAGLKVAMTRVAAMMERSQAFQEELVRSNSAELKAQAARWEQMGERFLVMSERQIKAQEETATCLERLTAQLNEAIARQGKDHEALGENLRKLTRGRGEASKS